MFIAIIFAHWLADFVFQTDEMAKNKSKSNKALLSHVSTYCLVVHISLVIVSIYNMFLGIIPTNNVFFFALINSIAHFPIDYVTSRISSKCWSGNKVHEFFVVIGFDQALHMSILYFTYIWLLEGKI